jgi:hypothetical protein
MPKPDKITVTFSVTKCAFEKNNGSHTIELDCSKISDDGWNQLALRSIVINQLQQPIRSASDTGKNWDDSKTFVVKEPNTRIVTEETVQKRIKDAKAVAHLLTDEEKRELAKALGYDFIPQGLAQADADHAKLEEGEQDTDEEETEEL